jgi:hypothetical protein
VLKGESVTSPPNHLEVIMSSTDIEALAALLHETSERHGAFEAVAPPHNWWDWYAAYMQARESGSTQDDAAMAAGRYMAEVKHTSSSLPRDRRRLSSGRRDVGGDALRLDPDLAQHPAGRQVLAAEVQAG